MIPVAPLLNEAFAAHQARRLADAQRLYKRVLKAAPNHPDALQLLGIVLLEQARWAEALPVLRRAVERAPTSATAHLNLGTAYAELGRTVEAIASCRTACRIQPALGDAWFNLGSLLDRTGSRDEASEAFDRAVALNPRHPGYRNNRALCLKALGRLDLAEADLREAVQLAPHFVDAWVNLGNLQRDRNRPAEATASYRRALDAAPQRLDAAASLYWLQREACDWTNLERLEQRLVASAREHSGEQPTPVLPFASLVLPLTARELRGVAASHARRTGREARALCPDAKPVRPARVERPDRLVVGYASADFHDHATAHLIAGLLEAHDRRRFDIRLYSYGRADESDYRRRLATACDAFVDVAGIDLCATAARIRDDGVHLLVDLKGYTRGGWPELFALRPAPVQVNYLGFPGTMGADWYDWYVTDGVCSPPGSEMHFVEKLAYLPGSYQPNDRRQAIADAAPTRAQCGLPEAAFVWCCFNQPYKIEPGLFDVWMRLLVAVPTSVLWLFRSSADAEANLRREADRRGVEPERLVFAEKLPKAEHLARHVHADLFLDTLRVNAHTTASDALWAGVPVLTCPGETFVSRVAAGLLHAAGLPELVMPDIGTYEATALRLAWRPGDLAALKERLREARLTCALFDTERYARNLECAYDAMWDAIARGQKPRVIRVAP